jgi:RecA-family ATPase
MKNIDVLDALSAPPPELDFVLPGLVSGTVGGLISAGGAGKSFLALQIAVQIASGTDCLDWGLKLSRGRVLYLASEDPEAALKRRVHALGEFIAPEVREKLCENFVLSVPQGLADQINLLSPKTEHRLAEHAQGFRLVILDTLRRFHGGNENDASDMARLVSVLEDVAHEANTTVLFLHHASKYSALNGSADEQQASRGSSVLVDNVRWQSYLVTMGEHEANKLHVPQAERKLFVRFGVSKQNYSAPLGDMWFRRHTGGVLRFHRFEKQMESSGRRSKGRKKDGF